MVEEIQAEGIQMRIVMVMKRTIKYLLGIIRGRIRIIRIVIKIIKELLLRIMDMARLEGL
jgi:hypothetical protein